MQFSINHVSIRLLLGLNLLKALYLAPLLCKCNLVLAENVGIAFAVPENLVILNDIERLLFSLFYQIPND